MEQEKKNNELLEELCELGTADTESGIQVLSVIGQVEGHFLAPEQNKTTKYEHLLPLLVSMEEKESVQGVLILLNTMGGDVEAGLAIAELIASMQTPTVSLVLGGGHSIGVPLACAARCSFIVPTATMTIHPVRATGTIIGVPQSLRNLEEMQNRICKFIVKNSKISFDRLHSLMTQVGNLVTDVGTVLDGEQAVKEGLIDGVGGLKDALAALKEMIEKQEQSGYNKEYDEDN
ncbi:MAG: ATP-dependent Clp protease proteolytic subunit [Clostridia bacterium]|nr:ATP-dependent Clp protease proteolytic subunit [Clostridia bacterium]MBQ9952906.1 ATP-dependent Clp protease proteolytic subunit [Clostridia bacterium]